MSKVYMDNGATSWPKAPGVAEAMSHYMLHVGVNVGRGAYEEAFEAERHILTLREQLNAMVNGPGSAHVVFNMNVTQGLNMILKGLLSPGDHVLISPLEHNAVMRPLHQLMELGVQVTQIPCNPEGYIEIERFKKMISQAVKAVVICHGSNVFGTIQDLEALGGVLKELAPETFFIADCAQTAGIVPIDMKAWGLDAVAFTGHKALLGPQGTGGFILTERLNQALTPIITGGTGSHSESEVQPEYLPDKFESGTPNTVGLYGLAAAVSYILDHSRSEAYQRERALTKQFMDAVTALNIPDIRIVGPKADQKRTAVVSLDFKGYDNAEVSYYLQKEFGIATRVGMHCAPAAHKSLGTYPQGTVRFSFSEFNTGEEITYAVQSIEKVLSALK